MSGPAWEATQVVRVGNPGALTTSCVEWGRALTTVAAELAAMDKAIGEVGVSARSRRIEVELTPDRRFIIHVSGGAA